MTRISWRRGQRAALLIVTVGLLLGVFLMVSPASAISFSDVYSNTYDNPDYPDAVAVLSDLGVIGGFPDGTFRPHENITRQQFAKVIVILLGLPVTGDEVCPYVDVLSGMSTTDPFYPDKYVAVCASYGITRGKTATHFDPYNSITRAQVITMVVRAASVASIPLENPSSAYYAGILQNSKFRNLNDPVHGLNVQIAEMNNLFWGIWPDTGSDWDIYRKASRGEVAQILWRLWQKMGSLPPPVVLEPGGAAQSGEITYGEEDWYEFTATTARFYTIYPESAALDSAALDSSALDSSALDDSILALYGPDNRTTVIATADDLLGDKMAPLTSFLSPGTYYVKVTAPSFHSGGYTIKVGFPVYADDFSDSSLWSTWQESYGKGYYQDGRYFTEFYGSAWAFAWQNSWEITDGVISVEAECTGVESTSAYYYGIVARLGDEAYLFEICSNGTAELWVYYSWSAWKKLVTAPLPAGVSPSGAKITLTASLRGPALVFGVNGTVVISTTSNAVQSGVVGVYMESSGGPMVVAFDNMYVLP